MISSILETQTGMNEFPCNVPEVFKTSRLLNTDHMLIHSARLFGLISVGLLVWRVFRFTLLPLLRPNEAKELPYWIPYLGHALSFFLDADGTFAYGRNYFKNTREPFSLMLGGAKVYVITAADDVAAVNRNSTDLTFDAYIEDMMREFGASEAGRKVMWHAVTLPNSNACSAMKTHMTSIPLAHHAEKMIRQQLCTRPYLEELQDKFLRNVFHAATWENMTRGAILEEASPKERSVGLAKWTQDSLLFGATKSFFGDALLRIEPNLFESFFEFDDKSWKLSYKVPRPWSNDMQRARQKMQQALTKYFELPMHERNDACWLIRRLDEEMKGRGIRAYDISAYLTMIYWVINSNAWKLCFWCLAHIVRRPSLLNSIRVETDSLVNESDSKSCNNLAARLSTSCPNLLSVYNEVLRLVTSSISVRDVKRTTTIGGKVLREGNRVVIPYRQLLQDKSVFGNDADDFRPERFLDNKELLRSSSFRPFGGGVTYCPGRFLAQAEVLVFMALVICKFDFEVVDGKDMPKFPQVELKKPCLGVMGPMTGHDVVLKIRRRVVITASR